MFRFVWLWGLAVAASSCSTPLQGKMALDRADALLAKLDLAHACGMYKKVAVASKTSTEEFMRAARGLVRCGAMAGRLGTLAETVERVRRVRGRDGASYLRAFMALAAGPQARDEAKHHFEMIRSKVLAADAAYRLGMMALENEDLARARVLVGRALAMGAGVGARIASAEVSALSGRFQEARRKLSQALVWGISSANVRRARRLSAVMDEVGAGMSPDVRETALKASRLMDRGLVSHAVELLEDAEEKGLAHARLHALLGLAHLQLGNDARAVAALLRAVDGPQVSWLALSTLGRLFFERGQVARARGYLARAVQIHPFDLQSRRFLALALERLKLYRAASGQWEKVVVLSERSAQSLRHWGLALGKAGNSKKAVAVLEEAVTAAPGDGAAWLALGDQLVEQYRAADGGAGSELLVRRAKRAYRKALAAKPGDPVVLMRLKSLGVDVAGLIR